MSEKDDELETIEVLFPADHVVLVRRDHHIMTYLRATSKHLDPLEPALPVDLAAIDKLWQNAYELGFESGAAVKHHAETAKKKHRGKQMVDRS